MVHVKMALEGQTVDHAVGQAMVQAMVQLDHAVVRLVEVVEVVAVDIQEEVACSNMVTHTQTFTNDSLANSKLTN